MRIFISWSGQTSREVATALARFIPLVLQRVSVFVSGEQVDKGARWYAEIAEATQAADFGIACLTKDNINNPWLAFEIGGLTARLGATRFAPILVDFSFSELIGPLATFQAVNFERSDMRRLLSYINETIEDPVPSSNIDSLFERFWPQLEQQTRYKLASASTSQALNPEVRDLGETLETLKREMEDLRQRLQRLEKGLSG